MLFNFAIKNLYIKGLYKMAQRLKATAAKPEDLSSILKTHRMEGTDQSAHRIHTHIDTDMCRHNKW